MTVSGPTSPQEQPKTPKPLPKRAKIESKAKDDKTSAVRGDLLESLIPRAQGALHDLEATDLTQDIKDIDLAFGKINNPEDLEKIYIEDDHPDYQSFEEKKEPQAPLQEVGKEQEILATPQHLEENDEITQAWKKDKENFEKAKIKTEKIEIDLTPFENLEGLKELEKKVKPKLENKEDSQAGVSLQEYAEKELLASSVIRASRMKNPYFYGELRKEQVLNELRKAKPSDAIFYYSPSQKPMIAYLESGDIKMVPVKEDVLFRDLEESLKGRNLIEPSFAKASESDINQLDENEAIVHYQNGYSFITEKRGSGITYSNLTGSSITLDKKLKIYSTLEDIKKKPYYFGEISKFEAEKILSQQKGPSIIVRKKGDKYYLHQKGIDPSGNPFKYERELSLKSATLLESNRLLQLEAELDFQSKKIGNIINRPKGMGLISNKLQAYRSFLSNKSKALSEGARTQALTITRRLFPPAQITNSETKYPELSDLAKAELERLLKTEKVHIEKLSTSKEEKLKDETIDSIVDKELKNESRFIEEMLWAMQFDDNLSGFIEQSLHNDPSKKELIIKTLLSWKEEGNKRWATSYYTQINTKLEDLEKS